MVYQQQHTMRLDWRQMFRCTLDRTTRGFILMKILRTEMWGMKNVDFFVNVFWNSWTKELEWVVNQLFQQVSWCVASTCFKPKQGYAIISMGKTLPSWHDRCNMLGNAKFWSYSRREKKPNCERKKIYNVWLYTLCVGHLIQWCINVLVVCFCRLCLYHVWYV